METLNLKLPYSDITLILNSIRHYLNHIETLDKNSIDEDSLADLLDDAENLKGVETHLAELFSKKFGPY
ncbi:hypothetical protein ACJJIX_04100 [Microbulbifer sp. VAAC004]|uniref:hypothetical protein n=1 Tax=unclassified Microbulbifer TaxID=2619833 RepID=UPI0040395360